MRERRLEINNNVYRVSSLRVSDGLWLHLDSETYFVDFKKNVKSVGGAGRSRGRGVNHKVDGESDRVVAPMLGKVIKINVKNGDSVTAEQIVVVMEAMKMEYNLTAPKTGRVARVHVHEGMQVELEQILVEFEVGKA